MTEYDFMPGDKVQFICNDGEGAPGTKKYAVYTVERVGVHKEYLYLKEFPDQGIYSRRFVLIPRYDKAVIMSVLIEVRDTTNSRSTWERAKQAIEELENIK